MKTIYAIIAYLAAVVLRFAEGNDTSDSQNRGAFYPLTTDTASPEGPEAKRAFKGVLRAVYNQPYIDIPPKPSRAYMGFCDALASIKKALANRQETSLKLALLPIECQNPPYYLVDYRINGSEKNPGVCVLGEKFESKF